MKICVCMWGRERTTTTKSPLCTGCVSASGSFENTVQGCVCSWKVFAGFWLTFYGSNKQVQLVLALPWALQMVLPLLYIISAPTFDQRNFRNSFHASACCTLTRESNFLFFFWVAGGTKNTAASSTLGSVVWECFPANDGPWCLVLVLVLVLLLRHTHVTCHLGQVRMRGRKRAYNGSIAPQLHSSTAQLASLQRLGHAQLILALQGRCDGCFTTQHRPLSPQRVLPHPGHPLT